MAIGVIWHPEIDQQAYDAVREKVMPAGTAKGMTFHAAGEAEGGWRIIETWDSREGLEQFIEQDLKPAMDEMSGGQAPAPEPEAVYEIYFQGP
jgi:hypothetical protein